MVWPIQLGGSCGLRSSRLHHAPVPPAHPSPQRPEPERVDGQPAARVGRAAGAVLAGRLLQLPDRRPARGLGRAGRGAGAAAGQQQPAGERRRSCACSSRGRLGAAAGGLGMQLLCACLLAFSCAASRLPRLAPPAALAHAGSHPRRLGAPALPHPARPGQQCGAVRQPARLACRHAGGRGGKGGRMVGSRRCGAHPLPAHRASLLPSQLHSARALQARTEATSLGQSCILVQTSGAVAGVVLGEWQAGAGGGGAAGLLHARRSD